MAYSFKIPVTYMGAGALAQSKDALFSLGKKALIVTGKIVEKTAAVSELAGLLRELGIGFEIFSDIPGEPTDEMVEAGVEAYRAGGCDFIIGIGGGSPVDTAKAVAAMSVLPGKIADYMGKAVEGDLPPFAAIPTTAGTGSEATRFSVITDSKRGVKMLLAGDALLPALAIVDPAFTLSAPAGVTVATGMDALTHAIESYVSRKANELSDLYALSAVRRIFKWLPEAYMNGKNSLAREKMALAAYQAGVCINNASVTLVHGMSRPIGALFHVPHGISNAMLLAECMSFSLPGCPDRFAAMAKAVGAAGENEEEGKAARAFVDALGSLAAKLNVPTLREYGIDKTVFDANIPKMASDAVASGSPANTQRAVSRADIEAIYKKLIEA
jgi:alcohol dehydrogenase class IV